MKLYDWRWTVRVVGWFWGGMCPEEKEITRGEVIFFYIFFWFLALMGLVVRIVMLGLIIIVAFKKWTNSPLKLEDDDVERRLEGIE